MKRKLKHMMSYHYTDPAAPLFGFDLRDVKERYAYVTVPGRNEQKTMEEDGDEKGEAGNTPLFHAFGPIINSMRLCGLFFDRPPAKNNMSRGMPSLSMVYCWLITGLGWGNVLFTFSSIRMVSGIPTTLHIQ